MTKRLLLPALLSFATLATLTGCPRTEPPTSDRAPYVDEWEEVAVLPAEQFSLLSIGDRISSDNFANRGDVEVYYEAGTTSITIEMQRFTVASSEEAAIEAFTRMQYWGYDASAPEQPSDDLLESSCENPDPDAVDSCYIRSYYDGLFQPLRDGANFRVTVPQGWTGDLVIVTSDNLEEGIDTYPDRSNVTVDGANGNLEIDLDSGNVSVRMDPNTPHYAGCGSSDDCEAGGHDPDTCGCTTPTNVTIKNGTGQASNIVVDVGAGDNWYTMLLQNEGTFSSGDDFSCTASIDCADYTGDCVIDPAYADLENQERAEINYPGGNAIAGAGMRIELVSADCANIRYADGVEDYDIDELPEEKRGDVSVCVGCL